MPEDPREQIQQLLVQINERLQKAKEIAREHELRFSVGDISYSPLNGGPMWGSADEFTIYIESDWYSSGC